MRQPTPFLNYHAWDFLSSLLKPIVQFVLEPPKMTFTISNK